MKHLGKGALRDSPFLYPPPPGRVTPQSEEISCISPFLKEDISGFLLTFASPRNTFIVPKIPNSVRFFKDRSKPSTLDLVLNSFLSIREGMTLYLLHSSKNDLMKAQIDVTFENLISARPVPEQNKDKHLRLVEVLQKNEKAMQIFMNAMRIKTTLLSKQGEGDTAFSLRMHLHDQGMSITDYSLTADPMDPNEFIKESKQFLEECRDLYSGSVGLYNEYYPE
jgi:hypothetical protein